MTKNKNRILELTVIAAAIGVFGISFDGFWHLTRGRESFFVLPHLFVYAGVLAGMYFSWQGYRITNLTAWKWIFRFLCLIPLSAPLDEIWHRWRGIESVDTPSIVWSPPHIIFLFAGLSALMILTNLISRSERLKTKNILGPIVLGMFLNILTLFLTPLLPMGPHQLLGAAGIGVVAAASISVFFLARYLFPETNTSVLTAGSFLLLQLIIWDADFYIPVQHSFLHIPIWLFILVYIIPAYFMDVTSEMYSMPRGAIAGFLMGVLFFGMGGALIPHSMFTYSDLWFGAFIAALAGLLGGMVYDHVIESKNR